jgi:hypothetical protein
MSAVPTFSGAPPSRFGGKNSRSTSGGKSGMRRTASSSSSSSRKRGYKKNSKNGDFREAWVSVQALGATQLHGWRRRNWEADAFEALGGKKQQREIKMPNKMRMGIMKKRKKRELKMEEEQRKADLVTGTVKKKKREKKRKQDSDPISARVGNAGGGTEESFRNGVLRVSNVFSDKKRRRR